VTDLVVAPRSAIVQSGEWTLISKQAEVLAMSDIIPVAYRRKPANIVVAALTGRTHGWDVLTAMRNGHVIEGQWGMKPEAMLGLVRAAGHHVDIELLTEGPHLDRGAIVTAHREGEAPLVLRFYVRDAVEIGLVSVKDGKPYARSSSGKRLPWEQYPVDMCMWRAVGKACRAKYSDITLGIYSVEELGAAIDAEGEVVDLGEIEHERVAPAPLSESVMDQFGAACATEGLTTAEVLARAFPDGAPDPLTDAHLPKLRDMFKQMVVEKASEADDTPANDHDGIEEGVVVPDDSVPADPESVRPATRAQVGKIKGEYERLGQPDRTKQLDFTADVVGRKVATHNLLTTDEAHVLIERLVALESA
jgi:hypothetical protein